MKQIISKIVKKIYRETDTQLNSFISIITSRRLLYKINFFLYKKVLLGLGINLHYDIKKSGEYNFLKSALNNLKKPVVFDVGANIGDYSKAIKKIKDDSTIYAFEPHPINYKSLLENLKPLNNILKYNCGLGKQKNKLFIYDYKNDDGSPRASIYKEVIEFMYGAETVKHEIEIDTIDNFVKLNEIKKINLLKIDTEGNELDVLKGALKTINEGLIDIIQFEFNYTNIIAHTFLYDFFEILKDYNLYRLLRKGMIRLENVPYNEIFLYQNIIAVKKII